MYATLCLLKVVQVYVAWTNVTVPVSRWTLVGFSRITLPLYHPQQLSFTITPRQMSVWLDDNVGFHVLQGNYCSLVKCALLLTQSLQCSGHNFDKFRRSFVIKADLPFFSSKV